MKSESPSPSLDSLEKYHSSSIYHNALCLCTVLPLPLIRFWTPLEVPSLNPHPTWGNFFLFPFVFMCYSFPQLNSPLLNGKVLRFHHNLLKPVGPKGGKASMNWETIAPEILLGRCPLQPVSKVTHSKNGYPEIWGTCGSSRWMTKHVPVPGS